MILVNGEVNTTVSCQDRGLQFGDGLFETIAVLNGEIMHWSKHWQRLAAGCERLFIPAPDEAILVNEIHSLLDNLQQQVIKLIVTRGVSERGYKFEDIKPTRIMIRSAWPEYNLQNAEEGIELYLCKTRLAHQPLLAGLKHLNRLENILARHEWQSDKFAEGLMCDLNGLVIEGTMSNIFVVKNGKLKTPNLSHCGVAGITRQRILEAAEKENIAVEVCEISKDYLLEADEIFICNSLIGIWPVKKIAAHYFETGNGVNSMTRLLQQKINLGV